MLFLSRLKTLTQTLTAISRSPSPPTRTPFSILSSYSYSSKKHKEDSIANESLINRDPTAPPRLFVVQPRLRPDTSLQAKLNEALCLANSLEEQRDGFFQIDFFDKALPPHVVVQNPIFRSSGSRAALYFGRGTVDDIKYHLHAAESKGEVVDAVFVNAMLTAIQQRNLERAWDKPVLDRVGLIIEIFNAHAHTREAKLQAELAALMYKKTRLVRVKGSDGRYTFGEFGEAEVVSARGYFENILSVNDAPASERRELHAALHFGQRLRGSGGRGFTSGAGETELHLQRQRISEREHKLSAQINDLRSTRGLQRAARKRHGEFSNQRLATVAVVGYTNAGKSTLISALSDCDLYSDSRLFATLDSKLRAVVLPSGRKVLLGDTVGFISDLPVQLVKAFNATLEEVVEADLLVHVIDCTAPNRDEHRATVLQVLQQIGVSEKQLQNRIEVWNKIDYEEEEMGADEGTNDGEDAEAGSLSLDRRDDVVSEVLAGAKDDETNGFTGAENGGDFEESIDDEQDDYSDGWLLSGDDQEMVGEHWLKTLDDQQVEDTNNLQVEKDLQCQAQHGPHVKISALTGVGLQELLELIDERLKSQDEEINSPKVLERDFFNRKWRPPQTEDTGIAVEQ